MTSTELNALITLLDDTDQEVFHHVSKQLLSLGTSIIPSLEDAWETNFDPLFQQRVENIIHKIQFDFTLQEFDEWSSTDMDNLLEGALLVARYQYPELDSAEIIRKVDAIKREIWLELNDYLSPLEQVNVFNQVFYRLQNFNGVAGDVTDPQNYFINHVVESRKGNALTLGILYLIVARQLQLPVYGVNLPHHFCLAYMKNYVDESLFTDRNIEKQILFYINPLNSGLIFTKNEINDFVKKMGMKAKDKFYLPTTNYDIINRLIDELTEAYKLNEQPGKADEVGLFGRKLRGL